MRHPGICGTVLSISIARRRWPTLMPFFGNTRDNCAMNPPTVGSMEVMAAVFTTTFDRGRYAPSIDYTIPPTAVAVDDREWAIGTAQPPANPASPS